MTERDDMLALAERELNVIRDDLIDYPSDGDWCLGVAQRIESVAAALRRAAAPAATGDVREALAGLVKRIEEIHEHPKFKSVWTVNQLHAGPYDGPTYVAELNEAKRALALSAAPVERGEAAPAATGDVRSIKQITTAFYYWWHNQTGSNTEQGFDAWAAGPGKELLSAYEHGQPDYVLAADRLKELQAEITSLHEANNTWVTQFGPKPADRDAVAAEREAFILMPREATDPMCKAMLEVVEEAQAGRGAPFGWPDLEHMWDIYAAAIRAATSSAPVLTATHNSGEGDPSVMPDCAGAETAAGNMDKPTRLSTEAVVISLCPICNKHSDDPCNLHLSGQGLGCRQNKEKDYFEQPELDAHPPADRDAVAEGKTRLAIAKIIDPDAAWDVVVDVQSLDNIRCMLAISKAVKIAAIIRNRGGDETLSPVLQERKSL